MRETVILLILLAAFISASKNFKNGNNQFTADLYKTALDNKNKNFFMSPFSIEIVLALLQSGADEKTGAEIRRSVGLPSTDDNTKSAIKRILPVLNGKKRISLFSANKIYIQNNFRINEKYHQLANDVYQAGVDKVDFAQLQIAASVINKWVAAKTRQKIHNLIDPNTLDSNSKLVLVNALYFKDDWSEKFYVINTDKRQFFKTSDNEVQVDTMHLYRTQKNYYEDQNLQAKFLELPFKDRHVTMVIVLPNAVNGIAHLENNLEKVFTPHNFQSRLINIALPKFSIDYSTDLKNVLTKLGIKKAFSSEADFSKIAGRKGELVVGKVMHKAHISVNEAGAEAAAATSVEMRFTSALQVGKPMDFIIDHPFLFYIKLHDLILFVGKVTDPTI